MSNAPVFSCAFKGPCKRMYNIKLQTVACCMSLRHARSFSAMCCVVSYKPRLFVRVAYVGSLLKERGLRSVQGGCSFAWLMSDLCFSELMRFIFYSTDRETTRPLVRLDNLDAVPSQLLNEMHFWLENFAFQVATTFTLYKLWKVFFHSYHVDSVRHDWHKRSL